MRTPPLLLGATLLFWGWQSDFLVVGALLGAALEGSRWLKARWDLSEEDFSRIWTFCTLLFLAAAVYAFTSNEGPSNYLTFFQQPNLHTQNRAGTSSARTAAALIRWLPMVFFLFMGAQAFSERQGIPLRTISLILSRRWKKAKKLGLNVPATPNVDISYIYFALCLVAASVHVAEDTTFFWGVCGLLTWGLWPLRSRRFGIVVWAGALGLVIALGYFGQGGLSRLRTYVESLNPQWLLNLTRRGFDPARSRTEIGRIGNAKASGRIVIRLEPKGGSAAPTLLREASYRTFKLQSWYAGASRNDFANIREEEDHTTWLLLPSATNLATVSIASYLPGQRGLLPLPTGTRRLEQLPAYLIQTNSAGAVFAQGPGLVVFDARYAPGLTIDSPPDDNEDLNVPPREAPALEKVVSELRLGGANTNATLRAVAGFFQGRFDYGFWNEHDLVTSTNETPLSHFLLTTRRGHCEYFATATVLLLRKLGIPARYAVGYAVHESAGTKYVVRQRDAHAWCLVWNGDKGLWEDFDTTPASWVEAERKRASLFQFLSDGWGRVSFELSRIRWGQTRLREYLLWALIPILALLLYQIASRARRRRRGAKGQGLDRATTWPGLDSEFYKLEKELAKRGVVRQLSEPLSVWLARAVAEPALREVQESLRELLLLHYRYRFDPEGLSQADRETLRRETRACLEKMAAVAST